MLTIELIEDDAAMRTLISEWLQAEGYRVRARSSLGKERQEGVDLVVTSLGHLDRDGADCVKRVREVYSGIPLIGLSTQASRTFSADSVHASGLGLAHLIPKPCRSSDLLGAVMDTIGSAT